MRLAVSFSAFGLAFLTALANGEGRSAVVPETRATPVASPSVACTSSAVLVEHVRNYDFFGARADAAGASLRQRLLVSMDFEGRERRFTGQTDWHIEWRACFEQDDMGCRIGGVTSTVNVIYTLPHWADRGAAPKPLKERWDRYIDSLTAHEKGHGAIALEVARRIEKRLVGLASTGGCEPLNERSARVVDEEMGQGEAMQRDYDRATFHGSAQGARFPF